MKLKTKKLNPKLLIFDFDGTIADTKSLYYEAIYDSLKKFGLKYEDINKAIDMGETLKRTLRKLRFGFIVSIFLEKKIMKKVKAKLKDVQKCKDVSVIKDIKQEKIIVSNSLKQAILPIIKHYKLKKYFLGFYGTEDFEIGKAGFIIKYLKEHEINPRKCIYIGDRVADVKVAKTVGCVSVIVSGKCAWDSKKKLLDAKPDYLIGELKELKRILN